MAMNKKEQEYVEELKTKLALRFTEKVDYDVDIPDRFQEIVNGYSFNAPSLRVEKSCSNSIHHSFGGWDKTTSQQPVKQYSTRLRALKAMRNSVEYDCAQKLRRIDKMIEAEELSAQDGGIIS